MLLVHPAESMLGLVPGTMTALPVVLALLVAGGLALSRRPAGSGAARAG